MKRHYLFLIALLFAFVSNASAAIQTLPTKTVGEVKNAANSDSNITVTVGEYSESIPFETYDGWILRSSTYTFSNDVSEFENIKYCPVNKVFCDFTYTKARRNHLHLLPQTSIDKEKIKAYLEELAKKVNREPADAKFAVVDGKVSTFSEAQDGITLDVAKSQDMIIAALNSGNISNQTLPLAFESKKASTNYGDVNSMGISSLIGEGVSDFKGSPVNRVKNIKVAMNRFNGLLIKPGEEFSFVKTLGEVDAEHGYFPELVIKNKITEPDFGGGICQVSSTTFRAAIYSGLKITARRNHAYPVSYYNPQGMDSTVYVPNPDLKFINNTPGYILIQAKIVGTKLYFDFYGTNDGRKITVDGPQIIEKQPDGALKATFTQHVFDQNGNEFINDVFNSSYASPYKYPHPGGPTLSAKPSNWTDAEWKEYQQKLKDMAKALKNSKQ